MKEVVKEGNAIDVSVAEHDLAAGELALRIPEHLVITLSRVFEDEVQPTTTITSPRRMHSCSLLPYMHAVYSSLE